MCTIVYNRLYYRQVDREQTNRRHKMNQEQTNFRNMITRNFRRFDNATGEIIAELVNDDVTVKFYGHKVFRVQLGSDRPRYFTAMNTRGTFADNGSIELHIECSDPRWASYLKSVDEQIEVQFDKKFNS